MKYIGIMTGNSLDAVDIVLSEFTENKIQDVASYTHDYSEALTVLMLKMRQKVKACGSDMAVLDADTEFVEAINLYTTFVAQAVLSFLNEHAIVAEQVKAIGFHGQTLDHYPPSIAGKNAAYTLQIGNAQMLADITQIPVVYDFRSDDIFNGGEGAPLAPMHNAHIAASLLDGDISSVAFCNAGNTGNIAIVTKAKQGVRIFGWDVGPFNHFPDMIVRQHWHRSCDVDGQFGQKGRINAEVLKILYQHSAIDVNGFNFYEKVPPKSSDPSWYVFPEALNQYAPEDVLRSAEYFSAYNFALSLRFVHYDIPMPQHFLLFGGGWCNPLCLADFKNILQQKKPDIVLPEHVAIFEQIFSKFIEKPEVVLSDAYQISGKYMEARIFADLAYCYFHKIPFCQPEITGCNQPTICGICCYPEGGHRHLYSRAAKNWHKNKKD